MVRSRLISIMLLLLLLSESAFALDLMPDLNTITNNICVSDAKTTAAIQHATKASAIQFGFQSYYNQYRNSVNDYGEGKKNKVATYIDDNTMFTHDQLFNAVLVGVMVHNKVVTTSFADPYYKKVQHTLSISQGQTITGIKFSF